MRGEHAPMCPPPGSRVRVLGGRQSWRELLACELDSLLLTRDHDGGTAALWSGVGMPGCPAQLGVGAWGFGPSNKRQACVSAGMTSLGGGVRSCGAWRCMICGARLCCGSPPALCAC